MPPKSTFISHIYVKIVRGSNNLEFSCVGNFDKTRVLTKFCQNFDRVDAPLPNPIVIINTH